MDQNGEKRPAARTRVGAAAALCVLALAAVAWFLVRSIPLAIDRSRLASAPTQEVIRIAHSHVGDPSLVERAASRLLFLGQFGAARALLSAVGYPGGSSRERARLLGLTAEAEVLGSHPPEGVDHAESSLELDPACGPATAALAFWSEKQGQWDDAASQLQSVLQADPNDDLARLHLARAEIQQGDFKGALSLMLKLVARQPESYTAHTFLASIQAYLGEFDAARSSFEAARHLNPDSFEARANVVRAAAFAARDEASCQRQEVPVSRLLPGDRDRALDEEILGMLEIHAGDTVAAQRHLERAADIYRTLPLSIATRAPEIFRNLTFVRALNAQDAAAEQGMRDAQRFLQPFFEVDRLRSAVEQDPEDASLRLQLARLYEKLGVSAEALDQYEEMRRLHLDESLATEKAAALSSQPEQPDPEAFWAWRVLATESAFAFPSKQ